MKSVLVSAVILLISTVASAQTTVTTGPVDTTMKLEWTNPVNTTLADAPTFEYRVHDSLSPTNHFVLTGVQCSGTTAINCTAIITQTIADVFNRVGSHRIMLTVFRSDVGESGQSLPFTLSTPPLAPTAVKIIR